MDDNKAKLTIREICKATEVEAPLAEVWRAWTTAEGAITFFAPEARIEATAGGAYELYFDLESPEGERGSEGCTIRELVEEKFLSVTWNFPPSLPSILSEHTTVGIGLQALGVDRTRVVITHTGWQDGPVWAEGFTYFMRAWDMVLGRLQHRFAVGPIDWADPFTPDL